MMGMTEQAEDGRCQLPQGEELRLAVGQTYVFEAFAGPGTEPNACKFEVDPETLLDADRLEICLPVRRVATGEAMVICENVHAHAVPGGHWWKRLPLPLAIRQVQLPFAHRAATESAPHFSDQI